MTENSTTSLTPFPPALREEGDTGGLWRRIRSGFQGALRHIWSEESPAVLPSEPMPALSVEHQPEPVAVAPAAVAVEEPVVAAETASPFSWTVVLSDTDNDFTSVIQTLWLTGLCDQNGRWMPGLRNIQVVHTGDWLNKWDPNPHVLDGFKRLQETTPEGCRLILLNGNHELSILQMADKGLRTHLTPEDLAFIRRQHLLHADHGRLFVHGYPSSELLMILKQFQRDGVAPEGYNDRLQTLFFEGNFPLFRETQGLRVIGDIKNPKFYYNQKNQQGSSRGEQAASILQSLGFATVVHGHRPSSEVQVDYELQEELPGVRMINNDNRIRQTNLGGVLLSDQGYAVFINPHTLRVAGSEKILRKRLCKLMGTRQKDLQPQQVRVRKNRSVRAIRIAA
ncbi:MAG: hypothetical protein HQL80_04960 [Magnetococcales bacterium]|nr:hypothetical protein [Magnetococcales bacterium]